MNTILRQLMRGAIQTGFFASMFALAELILLGAFIGIFGYLGSIYKM